tara:strand:+ start:790 stop:2658 length:1869 start_codon:yes stop_codon:yes gene_type:complete
MPTIPSSKQSIDGAVVNQLDSTAYSWANTRNASSGNGLVTVNPLSMSPDAYETSGRGNNYHINRCMLTFDFSGVSGTIVSLNLKLYKASGYTVYKDIIVVKNSNTYSSLAQLSNNDYNVDFSTPYSGDFTMGAGGAGTLKTIALNSDAKTDAVGNANFTVAICDYDHDYNNVTPLLTLNNYATFYYNQSSYYPRLEYTIDTGFGEIVNGVIHSNMSQIIGIGRLNVERVIDTPSSATIFNSNIGTGFDDYIYSIAKQSDGKFIIVGAFEAFEGSTRNGIVRLNSDGTEDTSFNTNIGTGFRNGTFRSFQYDVVVQSDGKILVGGNFDSLNGTARKRLVRLNSNGTVDTSFYTNLGTSFSSLYVRRMAIQSDGKIVVVGRFSYFNGNTRRYIIRLNSNGTEDTSFYTNLGTGFTNAGLGMSTVAIQSDGKIIVGGSNTTFNGNTRKYVVRLNSNGTEDTSFYTNLGTSFGGPGSYTIRVDNIKIQSDGKILVGGAFDTFNGNTRKMLVRLNSNGTEDTSFYTNLGSGFTYSVNTITIQSDGKILVGGPFSTFNGYSGNKRLVRLNSNGTLDTAFQGNGTPNDEVESIVEDSGNDLIVGGKFITIDGTTRNRIVKYNSDGSVGS